MAGASRDGGMMLPSVPPGTPGLPANPLFLTFDGFAGLNTKASRAAIEDQEMSWCDNFIPLGPSNLRALWGMGAPLYSVNPGRTIKSFYFLNIRATPYAIIFLDDGSAVAVDTTSGVITTVATAGTFTAFAPPPYATQWGNRYILICADQPNGYWVWDGISLLHSGTLGPIVGIANIGVGYTSAPTIAAVGGAGSGATFVSNISSGGVTGITVTNPGTGYGVNDAVILAFTGGGSTGVTARGTAVVSGGTIASVNVTNPGAGYTSSATGLLLGGGGAGATIVPVVSAGTVASVSVSAAGVGYSSAPTPYITDPNNPVAQAAIALMPTGVRGTQIETYAQHVWVIDGDLVFLSAPGSVSDFAASSGGGVFPSSDSFLRRTFSSLRQSNGFLYLVGDSSVNCISGVQTSGLPATTTFSNLNVDPQVGSPWPDTVQVYSRAVALANSFGIHAIYGGAVQKVSGPLDGIYTSVPQSMWPVGFTPSSAVAVIFGIHVYMLLLPIYDPITGLQRNALLMWDGQHWWTASQEVALIKIATQEIDSILTAWGTDGLKLYPLFQHPSLCLTKTVQSKLWDKPTYIMTKTSVRAYLLAQILTPINTSQPVIDIQFQVDTDESSGILDTGLLSNIYWINNASELVSWLSN